jgi:hypothetical protein
MGGIHHHHDPPQRQRQTVDDGDSLRVADLQYILANGKGNSPGYAIE